MSDKPKLYVTLAHTRYLVESPWGEFGPGPYIVSDVTCDKRGHVFVIVRRVPFKGQVGPCVIELAPDGRRVREWGEEVVDGHYGTVVEDGRVLIADRDSHVIVIFDGNGKKLGELGRRGYANDPLTNPCEAAVSPSGDFYVADGYGAMNVHRFSADGERLATWGKPGRDEGELVSPHAVLVLPAADGEDERILICDRDNDRVSIFTPDGQYLTSWNAFWRPMSAEFTLDGNILVTDLVPRLSLYSPKGELLSTVRSVPTIAHGVAPSPDGSIFLVHMVTNTLTRLTPVEQV